MEMDKILDVILYSRQGMVDMLNELSVEENNRILPGFNNNMIWNVAHVIAVDQAICYKRCGLPTFADEELVELYKNGSFPEAHVDQARIDKIKELAISSIETLRADYKKGLFKDYQAFNVTPREVEIATIEDAAQFVMFHEAMHNGYARALKRALGLAKA